MRSNPLQAISRDWPLAANASSLSPNRSAVVWAGSVNVCRCTGPRSSDSLTVMKRLLLCLLLLVSASVARAESMVVIVRHAEKAIGETDDPPLSDAGRARAETLSRMLRDSEISAIFKRTKETAAPTAIALKITPTVVRATEIATLADKLRELHGNALVVAHGNTIPDLIKTLGIDVPVNIPENDYDHFLIVAVGSQPRLLRWRYP